MEDIYQALKHDHDEVRSMLKSIASKKGDREEIFKELTLEVVKHSFSEERVLYHRLRDTAEIAETLGVNEGYVEHHMVNNLLQLMRETNKGDEKWEQLFYLLSKHLEAHMEVEEEHLFKHAKTIISKEEARTMAEDLKKEKEKVEKRLNAIQKSHTLQDISSEILEKVIESHEEMLATA